MVELKSMKCSEIVDFVKTTGLYKESQITKDFIIDGYCSLANVINNSIVFIKNSECKVDLSKIKNKNILVITIDFDEIKKYDINYIISDRPRDLYFQIIDKYLIREHLIGISNCARVYTDVIGKNTYIGDNTYICKETKIGDNVKIYPNVSIICQCEIGDDVTIFSGTVIGADGFGMYKDINGIYHQIPHVGGVKIGNNVVIGSNTCIDRGTIDDTVIGDNVKIDNLCHIGHNVCVGKNTLLTAGTVLGGSCGIGENSYFAPGSIVINGAKIGINSFVGMGSVVIKNVEDNHMVVGVPARFLRENK